ncbi:MAG: hypothetical protein HY549_11450 [Elusimicrobia bacterium]|nr:hypothetical protein [Elusimicrobiota bacterium]
MRGMINIQFKLRLSQGPLTALVLAVCAEPLQSENVRLSTYYPAPSGVYLQMLTTGRTILARDAGDVGIGTDSPSAKLDVAGLLRVGRYSADPPTASAGSIYYNTATDRFRAYHSDGWRDLGSSVQVWDSGCFPLSQASFRTFNHDLGGMPRIVTLLGSRSPDCSDAGLLQYIDSNGLGSYGSALYPITSTQVTIHTSEASGASTPLPLFCSHDFAGCSNNDNLGRATYARIILHR